MKKDVDYPLGNKRHAVRAITLYPPKIELRVEAIQSAAPRTLKFHFQVEGIEEDISLNVSLAHSPSLGTGPSSRMEESSSGASSTNSTPKSASDHSKSSVCSGGSLATGTPTSSIAASAEGDSDSSLRRKSRSSIANVGRGMSDSDIVNVRGSSNASEDSAVSTSGYNSQDSREGIS